MEQLQEWVQFWHAWDGHTQASLSAVFGASEQPEQPSQCPRPFKTERTANATTAKTIANTNAVPAFIYAAAFAFAVAFAAFLEGSGLKSMNSTKAIITTATAKPIGFRAPVKAEPIWYTHSAKQYA